MYKLYFYLYIKLDKKSPIGTLPLYIDNYFPEEDKNKMDYIGWINEREFAYILSLKYKTIDENYNMRSKFIADIKSNFPDVMGRIVSGYLKREIKDKPYGDYYYIEDSQMVRIVILTPFKDESLKREISPFGILEDDTAVYMLKQFNSVRKGD